MALYSPKLGLAAGIGQLLNAFLEKAIDPQGPYIARLLDGRGKTMSIEWRGPFTATAMQEEPDERRGDGAIGFHTLPADPLYALPPELDFQDLNIRMGVPLWVYGWLEGERTAIAAGLFHPLYVSATMDFWTPETGLHEKRLYVHDPRLTDEDYAEMPQQLRGMQEMGKLASIGAALPEQRAQLRPSLLLP